MRWTGVLALGIAVFPAIAGAATPESCPAPADLHDGWTVAAPAQEGLDPKLICAIGPTLEKMKKADANGVVVVRHGVLVYEHYFVGGIEYGADTLHGVHSVTKSVVAILVGIAFDRGYLTNLDAPIFSFFPQYAALRTPDKDRITLRDLLTMTSGLAPPESAVSYSDRSNIFWQMTRAPDPYRLVLKQPPAATPGTVWNYNSGVVELLGAILQKVSGHPLDKFAKKVLFDPLGIKDWVWAQMANDQPGASFGLWLRPRGLAKIGQLVLNRGAWHGHRIVSAAWIKQMTAWQSPPSWRIAQWGGSYGYLWWRGHLVINNHDIAWVGGMGYGGQLLYVVPSLDLVVTATAGVHKRNGPAGYAALAMAVRAAIKN